MNQPPTLLKTFVLVLSKNAWQSSPARVIQLNHWLIHWCLNLVYTSVMQWLI